MKSISRSARVLASAVCILTTCGATVDSAHPSRSARPGLAWPPSGPFTISNAAEDSVVLESGLLVDSSPWSGGTILDSRSTPHAVSLLDGSKLRLDAETPPGDYVLDDLRRLRVHGPPEAPLQYSVESSADRSLFFSIHSRARVGVLILPDDGKKLSVESAAQHFARNYGSYYPKRYNEADSVVAYEYPVDWRRRATIAFQRRTRGLVRILWLAYGTTPGEPAPPIRMDNGG